MNKKKLYENIISNVAKEVKKVLNEEEIEDLPIEELNEFDEIIENPSESEIVPTDDYSSEVIGILAYGYKEFNVGYDNDLTVFIPMDDLKGLLPITKRTSSEEADKLLHLLSNKWFVKKDLICIDGYPEFEIHTLKWAIPRYVWDRLHRKPAYSSERHRRHLTF